jgi:hypothetical protein
LELAKLAALPQNMLDVADEMAHRLEEKAKKGKRRSGWKLSDIVAERMTMLMGLCRSRVFGESV